MKSILITTGIFYPDIGGPASYAANLAKRLAPTCSVAVVSYSSVVKENSDKEEGYKIFRVYRSIPSPFRQLYYLLTLLFVGRKYDVWYALGDRAAGVPTALAAKFLRKKYFLRISGDSVWESAINRSKTNLLVDDFQRLELAGFLSFLRKLRAWVVKNAFINIAHSQYLKKLLMSWGAKEKNIRVVFNGVELVSRVASQEEARKKIGIPGSIIISAGRLAPWKGFKMLIKIMPSLQEINPFFRLVIVGDGGEREILSQIITNLGLQKKVFLVGKKSKTELAWYLCAADIFVLNTGYEGFSHQILEAMAMGVPVITTPVGGNPELIKQGKNGFMVKHNDEFNLIEAIRTLHQSKEISEQFALEGIKTAKQFNIEKMFQQTISALEEHD